MHFLVSSSSPRPTTTRLLLHRPPPTRPFFFPLFFSPNRPSKRIIHTKFALSFACLIYTTPSLECLLNKDSSSHSFHSLILFVSLNLSTFVSDFSLTLNLLSLSLSHFRRSTYPIFPPTLSSGSIILFPPPLLYLCLYVCYTRPVHSIRQGRMA